ncbi:acetyl-CoA:L-glutamate N-acetyltransferase [Sugiyamaella lignohabitans]|uniref:Amino-acid acetyltransferase, mitochondrial n=1 Tax=Sugiyamaella lignohabitans TaxID=796027 RepID=A0A167F8E2_9ASCO|nr:acetyl-CoA:L-glutamate N-acetyltransferase [Sugiyamaella lignohabitans]ANB14949.1 acetyl-CoA:L-glutamate N-acetyltransferase [Sugiyamaella lignohabitans]
MRVSVIKVRDEQFIGKETLNRIGTTVSQLMKLGVSPVIVLDGDSEREQFLDRTERPFNHYQDSIKKRALKMAAVLEENNPISSRPVEDLFNMNANGLVLSSVSAVLNPLSLGIVPVVAPLAYDTQTSEHKIISANDTIQSLVGSLHGNNESTDRSTVEKIIFIDPVGGIPSVERGGITASHIFINLEREFSEISSELVLTNYLPQDIQKLHLKNLQTMKSVLSLLPLTSAGIITTPEVAALSPNHNRNPIIYNVLTDRPVTSSSLPVTMKRTPRVQTTILRKGMTVKTMYSEKGLNLLKEAKVGNIDLTKLVGLINDSFRKTLDLDHYLNRVNGKVAGIIIAGDYEGAAIITWEEARGARVAYLDKFAVKSSSQGGSGVADIVFKAMMVRMFPREILWRSRANNPVNKWYFERSKGTQRVPNSHWMMFWNGSDSRETTDLAAYEQICASIEPSLR